MAAAAYRAGVELADARTGLAHDYTRKGGVALSEILTPDGGGIERNALWNAAEAAEKRKDARTAREWIVALPAELDAGERAELVRTFGRELASRYGVAVDLAIHLPDREGDHRNHHAHVLTTTRQVGRDAGGAMVLGEKATIELSDTKRRELGLGAAADEVKAVRALWEGLANTALERAGRSERIDARSLAAQGIEREPTTHLGAIATEMERRGVASDRGDGNRQALANNRQRAALMAEVIDLRAERERRERAAREAAAKIERERLARMTSQELAAEIERVRPMPVDALAREDTGVRAAQAAADWLAQRLADAGSSAAVLDKREAEHHGKGFFAKLACFGEPGRILREREELQARRAALMPKYEDAAHALRQTQWEAAIRIDMEQMPARMKVQELERLRQQKTSDELRQAVALRAEQQAARDMADLVMTAADLHRRGQLPGAPPKVIALLEQVPNAGAIRAERELKLRQFFSDPKKREAMTELLKPYAKQLERGMDRGLSR